LDELTVKYKIRTDTDNFYLQITAVHSISQMCVS
jgi:hypothetical protein